MKARIATALSLAGVLVAGSAAALVNSQILDGASPSAPSEVLLEATPSTLDTTPGTGATSTTIDDIEVSSDPQGTTSQTTFQVGDAGTVVVGVVAGVPVVVSTTPNPGWTVTEVEHRSDDDDDDGDDDIEVTFSSATVEVELEVQLVNGALVPRVESRAVAPSTTIGSNGGQPTTTIDDDDDDSDDDVDDRDDDSDDRDDDRSGSNSGSDDDHDDDDHSDDDRSGSNSGSDDLDDD